MSNFHGAKLAILCRQHIVTILRDDRPGLPWANHWDLPGGAREGDETPDACVLRETREELGLVMAETDLTWRIKSRSPAGHTVWFFVSEQPDFVPETVCFGSEGQRWELARIDWYLRHPRAIPHHRERLITYLNLRSRDL